MDTFDEHEVPQARLDDIPEAPQSPQETQLPAPESPPPAPEAEPSPRREARKSPYADSPYVMEHSPEADFYQPQTQRPPKKEKPSRPAGTGRRVLALVLICVLIAGSCLVTALCVNARWEARRASTESMLLDKISALQRQVDSRPTFSGSSAPAQGDAMTPSQLYQMCVDSVVAISISMDSMGYYGPAEAAPSGSGFILSQDGYVVTNYHVVEDVSDIIVILHDGSEYEAELVGKDSSNDVAVLHIDAPDLPAADLGSSEALATGDMVAAIGNPLGELTATQTVGYVSGIGREVTTDNTILRMIQTDAAINPGNSGGPLFNMYGQVIGITTAKYSGIAGSGASIEGLGFAIPIDDIKSILSDLMEYGYVTGAYLGVTVENVDAGLVSKYGLPSGAYVSSVTDGYAAQRAGIQPKDIIVDLGGTTVTSITELTRALRNFKAGDTTTITVVRSGTRLTLDITLDEKPRDLDAPGDVPSALPGDEDMIDAFRRFFGG